MNNRVIMVAAAMIYSMSYGSTSNAEETVLEKAESTKNKTIDGVKKAYRDVDENICETVNGKSNCDVKKLKNDIKNTTDKAKRDASDAINKID